MAERGVRGWGGGLRAMLAPLLLLVLLPVVPPASPSWAREPPSPLDAKARVQRRAALRSVAGTWITHRARFPSTCPLCQGAGRVAGRQGRQVVWRPCPQCKARGAWISPKDYRKIYYDMRTEAFRRLPSIQDALNQQYLQASRGQPMPTRIARYRIRDWELVDDTHGIVWFLYNADTSPTATYWVWSTEAKPRGEWCVYDGRSDGPWPDPADDAAPAGGAAPSDWDFVAPTALRPLRSAMAAASTSFRVTELLRRGRDLRVRLEPRGTEAEPLHSSRISEDAVRLVPVLFAAPEAWNRVELEWRTLWEDDAGAVRLKVAWAASMERPQFDAAAWDAMAPPARARRLAWTRGVHEGWLPVGGEWVENPLAAGPTAPPGRGQPDPSPRSPAPEAPPPPARPAPAPAMPEPAVPAAPPPLSATGRAAAEAGLARMRDLLAAARTAHDEGLVAHREGAHDLWQEKLTEARARLAEIEDVWREAVVAAMPPGSEEARDEQANELFGAVWDDVYELKARVRKTSTLR